jgi:hypothetical protein
MTRKRNRTELCMEFCMFVCHWLNRHPCGHRSVSGWKFTHDACMHVAYRSMSQVRDTSNRKHLVFLLAVVVFGCVMCIAAVAGLADTADHSRQSVQVAPSAAANAVVAASRLESNINHSEAPTGRPAVGSPPGQRRACRFVLNRTLY